MTVGTPNASAYRAAIAEQGTTSAVAHTSAREWSSMAASPASLSLSLSSLLPAPFICMGTSSKPACSFARLCARWPGSPGTLGSAESPAVSQAWPCFWVLSLALCCTALAVALPGASTPMPASGSASSSSKGSIASRVSTQPKNQVRHYTEVAYTAYKETVISFPTLVCPAGSTPGEADVGSTF